MEENIVDGAKELNNACIATTRGEWQSNKFKSCFYLMCI